MRVSGFTFVKNATKLYIPAKEAIASVLPLVDEFIVALGDNDRDDHTRAEIESLNSSKIKIIDTVWDIENYPKNTVFARETDKAKEACTGDWLFYIQCDEVLHERFYPAVKAGMEKYINDTEVEGLLFNYRHFWGDYDHVHNGHTWYAREIRIIKNDPNIHSWKDAQSFRHFQTPFDYTYSSYQSKEKNRKLKVALIDAEIYHYGFVRPPHLMSAKRKSNSKSYHGTEKSNELLKDLPVRFDYGPMQRIPKFTGTHPAVMEDWRKKFDWEKELQFSGSVNKERLLHKHERLKYRIISFIERTFIGRPIWQFENFVIVRKLKRS